MTTLNDPLNDYVTDLFDDMEETDDTCPDTGKQHYFTLVSDEMGDAHEDRLYADCSYMQCRCGETRDITDEDRQRWRDEADRDLWDARNDQ